LDTWYCSSDEDLIIGKIFFSMIVVFVMFVFNFLIFNFFFLKLQDVLAKLMIEKSMDCLK